MSSNSIGKNIANAFKVVYSTYENVQKLISYLQNQAAENSGYVSCSDKFLRWNSDKNIEAWAYHSFILLFQSKSDAELKNGWRDGPLYVIDINLYDFGEATVQTARFDYGDVNSLPNAVSPGDHWRFDDLLTHYDEGFIEYKEENKKYTGEIKDIEKADRRYWGLRRVKGQYFPLSDITVENVCEKIFGVFDKL